MTDQQYEQQVRTLLHQLLPVTQHFPEAECELPEPHNNQDHALHLLFPDTIDLNLQLAVLEADDILTRNKPLKIPPARRYQSALKHYQNAVLGWQSLGLIP